MRDWFSVQAAAGNSGGGEILIYDVIGKSFWNEEAVGAKAFVESLNKLAKAGPGDIHIRINSPGGDVGDGMAIYNAINAMKDRCVCTIDGIAYSMASVIALAGRETRMYSTARFMVHNPRTRVEGEERDLMSAINNLRAARSALVQAYTDKTGSTSAEVETLMAATTWMTAARAKELGFIDSVISGQNTSQIAARFDEGAWLEFFRGGPLPAVSASAEEETPAPDVEDSGDVPHQGAETPKELLMKLSDIKAACPGATAEFVVAQFELCEANEGRSIEDVLKAHNAEQAKALEAANARAAAAEAREAEAKASEPEIPPPGVTALGASGGTGDSGDTDPITAWDEAVEAFEAKGLPRQKAIRKVVATQPEVHAAYVRAHNDEFRRPAGRFAV